MKTSTQILPGVRAIGWVDCDKLPRRVDLQGICGNVVAVLTEVTPIAFFGEPECRCKTEREAGRITDTASLSFRTDAVLPLHRHIGFVVIDQNGKSWLIGAKEAPYPTVKLTIDFGTPEGDPACNIYDIEHTALKSLILCIQ